MKGILRFGIVGTNFISDRFMEAVIAAKMAEAVAVLSRTEEKGQAFAKAHGISKVYTEEQAFLSDTSIDAVYIAVPNSLHFAYAAHALEKGKHVLCEKPMCENLTQLNALLDLAKQHQRLCIEAMRPAFDPAYQILKDALSKAGKIRYANLDFCQYSSRYDAFLQGDVQRAFNPIYSNAAVMDIGVYPLHIAVMLFGSPLEVGGHSLFLKNGFEGMGTATLVYPEMLCHVTYSKITQSATPSIITGETGTFLIDKLTQPTSIIYRSNDGKEEKMPLTPLSNNMIYEVETFSQMVLNGEKQHPVVEQAKTTIGIIDQIRRKRGIQFSAEDPLFKC